MGANAAADALFVVNLQIKAEHVQGQLGACAYAAGASEAFLLVVNELFHLLKYIKK